jgi:hypothetical protein
MKGRSESELDGPPRCFSGPIVLVTAHCTFGLQGSKPSLALRLLAFKHAPNEDRRLMPTSPNAVHLS